MGEKRMRELGIPRRSFLKKAATATFAAPVVVSFGMDALAEADTASFPNQTFPYSKDQCFNGGWRQFGFKNQGDCVSFVATKGKNPPG